MIIRLRFYCKNIKYVKNLFTSRRSFQARHIKRATYMLINSKRLVLNYSNANTSDNAVSGVVCSHLIAGIVGLNPTDDMYVYLLYLLYRLRPGLCVSVCVCMWSRNLNNEKWNNAEFISHNSIIIIRFQFVLMTNCVLFPFYINSQWEV